MPVVYAPRYPDGKSKLSISLSLIFPPERGKAEAYMGSVTSWGRLERKISVEKIPLADCL